MRTCCFALAFFLGGAGPFCCDRFWRALRCAWGEAWCVLACVHGQANVSSASEPACCPPHGQWDVLDVHLHRFFRLVVRVFVRRTHIRPQQAHPPAWGAHPTDLSYSFCFCWPASHCRGLGLLCCVTSHPIRISHTRTARCDRRRPHTRASSPELLLKLGPLLVRLPLVPAGRMEGGRNA